MNYLYDDAPCQNASRQACFSAQSITSGKTMTGCANTTTVTSWRLGHCVAFFLQDSLTRCLTHGQTSNTMFHEKYRGYSSFQNMIRLPVDVGGKINKPW